MISTCTKRKYSIDQFHVLKVIGKGCMGKVMLVRDKLTDSLYALKSISKSKVISTNEIKHTILERDILAEIQSCVTACNSESSTLSSSSSQNLSFLIKMQGTFQSQDQLFILLQYHPGGDLAGRLTERRCFSANEAKFYASEILLGIEELHLHGIIYRDLKPENVLLSRTGHVVLTDFGLSAILRRENNPTNNKNTTFYLSSTSSDSGTERCKTFCGTPEYLAPEILTGTPYSEAVDLWSFGVLLYEMMAGITPFWNEIPMKMYTSIIDDPLEFPPWIGKDARILLNGLLQKDPKQRFSVKQAKETHFFHGIDWNALRNQQYSPPFIPRLKSEEETFYFENEFTSMQPAFTPQSSVLSTSQQNLFSGFSYNRE